MRSRLNLASQTYVNRRALYLFYAVSTAVVLLLLLTQFRYLTQLQKQENLLNQRIGELNQQLGISTDSAAGYSEDEFNQLLEQIDFSNKLIVKDSFQWTGLLGQFETVVPADVRITDIRPDFKTSMLNLTAQARTVADLRLFIDRLNDSEDFSEVLLLSQGDQVVKDSAKTENFLVLFTLRVKGVLQ